jgi:VCBS repeat-containing protein
VATYWVRSTGGDDGNGGESYADAFATLTVGLEALADQGDVLNIVASATPHACPTTGTALPAVIGTSWAEFGFKIQGVDAEGEPAIATIQTGATTAEFILLTNRFSYTIVQGLHFDATAAAAYGSSHAYIYETSYASTSGPLLVRWCAVTGGNSASGNAALRRVSANARHILQCQFGSTPGVLDMGSVEYCYFFNDLRAVTCAAPTAATYGSINVHHCVFYDEFGITPITAVGKLILFNNQSSTGGTKQAHHNTYVKKTDGSTYDKVSPFWSTSFTTGLYSTTCNLHSNIFAYWSGSTATPAIQSPFYAASAVPTITNRAIGSNIFKYEGTFVAPAAGWYYGFVETTSDPGVGDVVLHSGIADHSDLFHAPTTPWIWAEPLADGGYTITLPGDLRPVYAYRTTGLAGSVPGATAGSYDVAPTATASSHACVTGDSMSGSVTMSDPDSLPDPVTAVLDSDVSHGVLVLNSDGTFTYTAGNYFVGTDAFTFHAYDGELSSIPVIVSIVVTAPPIVSGAEDPDDPVSDSAYVDVLPWFEPDLQCSAILSVQTKRNRTVHHDSRSYAQTRRWREALHRVITLGTSTTQQVTLGGIQTARSLFLETSAPIDVAVDETSAYWPVSNMVAMALTSITSLYVRNNSTTSEATIILSAVD